MLDVLHSAGISNEVTEVAFESVTGHRIVLPLADLHEAVLATHVGDEVLSPGHGVPAAAGSARTARLPLGQMVSAHRCDCLTSTLALANAVLTPH